MPGIFDAKRLAREHPLQDENRFEIAVPKELGQERQSSWDRAISGRLMDMMSTGYDLANTKGQESNPTLKWAGGNPAKTVMGLAATDLAMIPILKMIEKKKPKLAKGLLNGLGGLGAGLSMNNYKIARRYQK